MANETTTPEGLADAGSALWTSVTGKYVLRVDERSILLSACKTVDRIAMLEKAHADLGQPFLTRGSMGQDVIHPLIAEMRAQESHLAAQFAKLKLPDDAGAERPNQQRAAAQTRWSQAHGAGA